MYRKLKDINGSLVITIPRQVVDLYGFKAGDQLTIGSIGMNELYLKKVF